MRPDGADEIETTSRRLRQLQAAFERHRPVENPLQFCRLAPASPPPRDSTLPFDVDADSLSQLKKNR